MPDPNQRFGISILRQGLADAVKDETLPYDPETLFGISRFESVTKHATEKSILATMHSISERLESIERKLDLIFGSYVLVNGRFINPKGGV